MREIAGRDELPFLGEGPPTARLVGLVAALTGTEAAALRALPLPAWEAALLDCRAATLGPRVEAEAACPTCGAGAAFVFDARDLPRAPPEAPSGLHALTTGDLADLEASGATGAAALAFLLGRASGASAEAAAERLAGPEGAAQAEALEGLAAGLGVELAATCVACGAAFAAPFDVAAFLHGEMAARAARLLDEIHLLASAYHWAEADILDLPVSRRQAYLSRILADRSLPGRIGAAA